MGTYSHWSISYIVLMIDNLSLYTMSWISPSKCNHSCRNVIILLLHRLLESGFPPMDTHADDVFENNHVNKRMLELQI